MREEGLQRRKEETGNLDNAVGSDRAPPRRQRPRAPRGQPSTDSEQRVTTRSTLFHRTTQELSDLRTARTRARKRTKRSLVMHIVVDRFFSANRVAPSDPRRMRDDTR